MESPVPIEAEEVLQFWLSETPMERRFVRDKALDAAIRERFGALHARLAEKVPQEWRGSEEHTSELQSLMRISYAVFCLKKKNTTLQHQNLTNYTEDTYCDIT